ncbi:MAG: GTPase Era [Candidatus Kapabacteria bacterium]|nr:GTPase Era [Ignavibacteriota bacterium]MCW5886274.1 GTPase Era [Candidatus Kapabacteria bacterium]
MNTKAGYVAIIGKPNSGKSTLLNSILGTKLSIVTPKPQTTRKRVLGIYSKENVQIVFLDTPGILSPKYTMQEIMMDYVSGAVSESDLLVVLLDMEKYPDEGIPESVLKIIKNAKKPVIAALNKVDKMKDRKEILPFIDSINKMEIFNDIVPIAALKDMNTQELLSTIEKYLPEHEFYYDEDLLSTQNERFFVSELIRENIFLMTKEELPYSTEVSILEFKERDFGKWYIHAEIIVERDSQKRIIIGSGGSLIKDIGEKSRILIEEHLGQGVFLELFVKVRPKWRNDAGRLRSFGY